jgi:soluble cytochrome b562
MKIDYSKVFELLNQDAEKERNKKAEKVVHDNLYNKGFRDGLAVLDKIIAEIESCREDAEPHLVDYKYYRNEGLDMALDIIDKYKAESEDKE